ncbi:MAG: Maf family nucleotide pyrophosphatase [Pseudomonadales bacterium]|nr:Maf family nucleotide pyrophosphatase [Pseudomonadales bacterium]NRA18682.1 septum formation inhibitor Maf [Oceanospirillaceae bacterium]
MQNTLVLASSSPRRKKILIDLGVSFEAQGADIDESLRSGELATDYVQRLAREKCQRILSLSARDITVLGSDTSVVIGQQILGKPESEQQAVDMLMSLSGKWHTVMTAVALVNRDKLRQIVVSSEVEFCQLDEQMCRSYWMTGEPADKAGSYAIQGVGARFVKQIRGSYSAIVGLPVVETADLLLEFNIPIWNF